MQISRFEESHSIRLPAIVWVNGRSTHVQLVRLAVFTRDRFFHSIANALSPGNNGNEPATLDDLHFTSAEWPAADIVFSMIDGRAPEQLSIREVGTVLAFCKYIMADVLVTGLVKYLRPMSRALRGLEVHVALPCACDPDRQKQDMLRWGVRMHDDRAFMLQNFAC
jgi:hypothetical protein